MHDRERTGPAPSTPPTAATRLLVPELRPESIPRARLVLDLQAAVSHPLTVIAAPAGSGKTTAIVQWLEHSGVEHAWLTLDNHDNDPRWLIARLLAALDRALPGRFEPAVRALQSGLDLSVSVIPLIVNALAERDGERLAIVLDDYHRITDSACHEAISELIDDLPAGVSVIVASRTSPPLRLGRRRAAGALAELGLEQLHFELAEAERLLNGSLHLTLGHEQVEHINDGVSGWAAGLALVATALAGREDRDRILDAVGASRASLDAYLVEEVLDAARPDLRDFLCRTSILGRLSAPLCRAVLDDRRAPALLDEVRRNNLFVTAVDPDGTWLRYHELFAGTLQRELERREPELVDRLHMRAADWFEGAGMPEEAIEHALAAGDGQRAASLLASSWRGLISERRYVTLRRFLDRMPDDCGELGPFCKALDLLCAMYQGVDHRLTYERAERLLAAHGDDPRVRQVLDEVLISPFYGDIGHAVAVGFDAWERYADDPDGRLRIAPWLALVLWFAGRYDEVRALLEPRAGLDQPVVGKVLTLGVLAMTAADEGRAEVAERYAREAMAEVEAVGGVDAVDFSGVPLVLAEALRVRGKLDEARRYLSSAFEAEAARPGSIGHAVALTYDARLALSEGDRARARASAARAREIVDRYRDLGTLETRLARVEAALEDATDNPLLGTQPTRAELRVLELLDSERTLAEIAAELYVSQHTVKSHAQRLYRRLGASTREAAVAAARERGLL
jgi:LuxR family transcriptional regulator, maltose regulon positive regulatory protein